MKNQFVLPSGLKNLCEDFVNELKSLFEKERAKELRQCWLQTLPTIHKAIRVQCFLIWRRDRITQRRIDEARRKEVVLPDVSKMNDIESALEDFDRSVYNAVETHKEDRKR